MVKKSSSAPLPATTRATRLHGMKAICQYSNRSPATLLKWIRELDFPATKVGVEWVSDAAKIDAWYETRFTQE